MAFLGAVAEKLMVCTLHLSPLPASSNALAQASFSKVQKFPIQDENGFMRRCSKGQRQKSDPYIIVRMQAPIQRKGDSDLSI